MIAKKERKGKRCRENEREKERRRKNKITFFVKMGPIIQLHFSFMSGHLVNFSKEPFNKTEGLGPRRLERPSGNELQF